MQLVRTLDIAQCNMLQKQLREQFMLSESILSAMQKIPRHVFVPNAYKKVAYADFSIPLAYGEHMMLPNQEARMLAALNILPTDKILEIGTGSGYVTALLATLGHSVISLDIHKEFIDEAAEKLEPYAGNKVKLIHQNGVEGYELARPFDVICITGGLHYLHQSLLNQIRAGGRVFTILGEQPSMTASLFQKNSQGSWQQESLFETEIDYLVDISATADFHF